MLFHSANIKGLACPVCNIPGHVCGESHMHGKPIDSREGVEAVMADEKLELKEYEYYVGNIPTTAMLTEKMAKRLNAKPVGEASPDDVANGGNTMEQNQAVLGTTDMQAADAQGTTGGTEPYTRGGEAGKARKAQNKAQ